MDAVPLSEAQQQFVDHDGSVFVTACPGAGKTRAIVARYLSRAASSPRKGVALISFTNAVVDEVTKRCAHESGLLTSPNFVGTIDTFIQKLIVGPYFATRLKKYPRFIESWDVQHTTRIIPDKSKPYIYFSLEDFSFDSKGDASLEKRRLYGPSVSTLLQIYEADPTKYNQLAKDKLKNRRDRGYVSCSDARWIMQFLLAKDDRRIPVINRLTARFSEFIIDEVQDCSPQELLLLNSLKAAGTTICAVGDLDQAIYEFRNSVPKDVLNFGKTLGTPLVFPDNFRSSPAICAANSSFRYEGANDIASGKLKDSTVPVRLLSFSDLAEITDKAIALFEGLNLDSSKCAVLSHTGKDARVSAGASASDKKVNRFISVVAKTSITLRSASSSPSERKRLLDKIEIGLSEVLLHRTVEDLQEAADELKQDVALFRTQVVRLCLAVDPSLTREAFTEMVKLTLKALPWPTKVPDPCPSRLATPPTSEWDDIKAESKEQRLPWSTIHGAKGLEYEGVCLVIPKSVGTSGRSSGVALWIAKQQSEARRVLYVGASRACDCLLIAVHSSLFASVKAQLELDGVPVEVIP